MNAKYDYFKKGIKTPGDFICVAASKSEVSGRPYLVKTKEGKQIQSAEWSGEALKDHRISHKRF